jgi:hypothetical protein
VHGFGLSSGVLVFLLSAGYTGDERGGDCKPVMDLSRSRSRIFCDTGNGGNRRHVAAYRELRARQA